MGSEWLLDGAVKDQQSITADWEPVNQTRIDGVRLREIKHVLKDSGYLTEIYRRDWLPDDEPVEQVFQVVLDPGRLSAWHAHERTTDRLMVIRGLMKVALYDGRQDSRTFGLVNVFRCGEQRPALIVVPPRVWHGVANIGEVSSAVINLVDRAYEYERPDHWRLPPDTDRIPYRFVRENR
jgi:dTDP-4-dehydrorhamnose 3,5-epimerase